ncbi:MAG: hypothetical protein GPJ51_09005 [Candidatus Heimdallarchaeota archaeon]|nr:hypothetical protein [Candidatus Heimdallarchaeota archaeon]
MCIFSTFNLITTLYYGIALRIKLSWYSRKKRKKKKMIKIFLVNKLEKERYTRKNIEKIAENYLKIGDIFFDQKNMRTAFRVNRLSIPKKTKSKNKN